jgi:tripartite-type tricarboxylate transporter receptor subunit TctC
MLPDVPTVVQAGFDYELETWVGLVAPAKTPKEKVSQLANWFSTAMQIPDTKAKLLEQGLNPVGICDTQFGNFLRNEFHAYGVVVREANMKTE